MPALPPEITGQTTMRDIVFRPETTMQRIAPFDDESLQNAFTVEAGPVPDVSDSVQRRGMERFSDLDSSFFPLLYRST
jgi:hypothetical protein